MIDKLREGMCAVWDCNEKLTVEGLIQNIVNTMLFLVGVLAVVMMIYGGILYTTSAGDMAKVTKAKNTIVYGLVGLVISVMAFAIVNFVLSQIG